MTVECSAVQFAIQLPGLLDFPGCGGDELPGDIRPHSITQPGEDGHTKYKNLVNLC